jgi:hypothetical protein
LGNSQHKRGNFLQRSRKKRISRKSNIREIITMTITYSLRQYLAAHTEMEARPHNGKYEAGHDYFCADWSKPYTVLDVEYYEDGYFRSVTVKDAEGIRKHGTPLDARDCELVRRPSQCTK